MLDKNLFSVAEPGSLYKFPLHSPKLVEILVDCSWAQGLFTYRIPEDLIVNSGDVVSVPFGESIVGGIAIKVVDRLPENLPLEKIKDIEEVVSSSLFPKSYWQLLNLVANYYCTDLMAVIKVALPPGLLGKSQRRIRLNLAEIPHGAEVFCSPIAQRILEVLRGKKDGDYSDRYLQRQVKGANRGIKELIKKGWVKSYLEHPKNISVKSQKVVTAIIDYFPQDLTQKQREVLEILQHHNGELFLSQLQTLTKCSTAVIEGLERKGCVVIETREILRYLNEVQPERDCPKQLNALQTLALASINNLSGFTRVLLHGVTGSGKTEVYLQAIAPILDQGQSALVLVPEIGLTPQLTDRFRARFGDRVLVYHSGLSEGERYDTWRSMLETKAQIAIGTRSAIFAPLANIGLIILDEEHDSSFKQDRPAPTYNAQTVAVWRAQLENCPIILGSATPSLESWLESKREKGIYLSLPERISSRPLPSVEIIDMRQELQTGNRSIFSRRLQETLSEMKNRQQQGILFVPRRGHSTFVSCRNCGWVIECPHCDVSLSYHYTQEGTTQLLRCHYCNHASLHPEKCLQCGSPYLKFFGSGTQKVTQELEKLFPEMRSIRFDSDTTNTKGAHRQLLDSFARQEADLLVGTQMLTKGIDLERVTLVGIVAADGLLNRADYRATERAFQTLTQVAGRAGRGEELGRVILQTYSPEHPAIQAVRDRNWDNFVKQQLVEREELNYPPYGRLMAIKLSGLDNEEVRVTAEAIVEACADIEERGCEILGPAPAVVMRVADRYRWNILLKFSSGELQNAICFAAAQAIDIEGLRSLCPRSISMTIDVDPLNID